MDDLFDVFEEAPDAQLLNSDNGKSNNKRQSENLNQHENVSENPSENAKTKKPRRYENRLIENKESKKNLEVVPVVADDLEIEASFT